MYFVVLLFLLILLLVLLYLYFYWILYFLFRFFDADDFVCVFFVELVWVGRELFVIVFIGGFAANFCGVLALVFRDVDGEFIVDDVAADEDRVAVDGAVGKGEGCVDFSAS